MTLRRRLAPLVIAWSVLTGCAHRWMPGWRTMQTRHFTLYTPEPRDAREFLIDLEARYRVMVAFLQTFASSTEIPRWEVVALDAPTFSSDFGINRFGLAVPTSPGASPIGKQGLMVEAVGRSNRAYLLASLFLGRQFPRGPRWLQEGLAAYLASGWAQAGRACYGTVNGDSYAPVWNNFFLRPWPLERTLDTPWDAGDTHEERGFYRLSAHLLVHMIVHGAPGPAGHRLAAVFEAARAGKSSREVLAAAYPGVPFEEIQRMFDAKMARASARSIFQCLPVDIPPALRAQAVEIITGDAPTDAIALVLHDLQRLPLHDGYPVWYPPEAVAGLK